MTVTDAQPANRLDAIRRWMRSDMTTLRWVFAAVYVLLIVSLFAYSASMNEPLFVLICLGVLVAGQALFILGGGTMRLCRPIQKRRLVVPVAVSALALTLLVAGLACAVLEFFEVESAVEEDLGAIIFFGLLGASWLGWGILLFAYTRELPRFKALSRLARLMLAGSLAELLATVPAHILVSRRPGCLVGIMTMVGIIAGVSVMIFSFGPMLVLLFLRPRHRRERNEMSPVCDVCGYDLRASRDRCPECGTPIPAGAGAPIHVPV